MKHVRFNQFRDVLDRQGVTLESRVLEAGVAGHSSLPFTLEPTGMLAAIAEAGRVLRKEPGRQLADRTVALPRRPRDTAQSVLGRIINTSIEPDVETRSAFLSTGAKGMDTCNLTERLLEVTVDLLRNPRVRDSQPDMPGCQVICRNGQPLFLREGLGERISLALADFSINGTNFPAGSLARIDLYDEPMVEIGGQLKPAMPTTEFEIVPTDRIGRIAFIRLSAFALPIGERSVFETNESAIEGWGPLMPRIMNEHIEGIAETVSEAVFA